LAPVTVEDVIFSMESKYSPMQAYYRRREMEQTGEASHLHFDAREPRNAGDPRSARSAAQALGEGADGSGKKRDVGSTTLEPPLGNGAYRIKEVVPGRTIVYERVKDYWAKDLNVNIGRDNFDESGSSISATPQSRSRRSRPIMSTGGPRTAPRTGPPPMTSPR
jgi:microcin C transport system substrate-binding protein